MKSLRSRRTPAFFTMARTHQGILPVQSGFTGSLQCGLQYELWTQSRVDDRLRDDRHFAVVLARRLHRNLNVLSQGGKKIHKALNGETTRAVAHQQRDMRLLDAKDFAGLAWVRSRFLTSRQISSVSFAFKSSCSGCGRPRSANTLPLLFSALTSLVRLVAMSVLVSWPTRASHPQPLGYCSEGTAPSGRT